MVRTAGLATLLTEGPALPPWLADEVHAAGLWLGGGIACFSDHATSISQVPDALRPVGPDGIERPQIEWYRGIIPTDALYASNLVSACARAASDPSIALFTLDFIRWPIHWELELRPGAAPIDSSFDPITLAAFRDWMGVDIPIAEPAAAAPAITEHHLDAWIEFKCRVITDLVSRIVEAIRVVRPELLIAAFIVPGSERERRRHAGQDVGALGALVDVLMPMTYHAILRRPPQWVGEVVADVRRRTTASVVPVVQVTAEPLVAGPHDWGAPFAAAEMSDAIDSGLAAGAAGFVVFPAHGLDEARTGATRVRAQHRGGWRT